MKTKTLSRFTYAARTGRTGSKASVWSFPFGMKALLKRPMRKLRNWNGEVREIEKKYPTQRAGEIVFYGGSGFARWRTLDEDFAPDFRVQNHSFGTDADRELMRYADRLLYPYAPEIVVLQTGYEGLQDIRGRNEEEKVRKFMAYREEMLREFHKALPFTRFVVVSGLLHPGKKEDLDLARKINREMEKLGAAPYITLVNTESLTWNGSTWDRSLFDRDMVHLNRKGELALRDAYILPALRELTGENRKTA